MKKQERLSDLQKESFGILYYSIKNSVETCEALMRDKNLSGFIRHNFVRLWEINLRKIKTQLDVSLGCNENFEDQIKETDTMGLFEIIKGYIAMSPEGREAVENLFQAINNNEEIKMEVA